VSRWGFSVVACVVAMTLVACGAHSQEKERHPRAKPRETHVTLEPPAVTEPKQKLPNVLVIEADDMRWDDLRFMPNVRRLLQRRGLTFENSFAPYPLCCPSRASFLTGQYAHNHHVYSHEDPYGFAAFHDKRTIATVLQKAGYRTALVGKYLNGYGQQPLRTTGESSLNYVPPGWTQWMAGSDHQWHSWDPFHGGTYAYFDLTQNVNGAIKSFPGRYSTGVLGAQTRGLISRFGQGRAPWFIWWTPVAPHHGSPIEPDDPPPSLRSDGLTTNWVTPARPDWVKGRFDKLVTHGAGTPPTGSAEADVTDKPRYLRKLPELTSQERDAETEVTRQRAESLFVLDVQIGQTI
jgi:N-acetylglucosamine-6-sulfatase